MVLQLFNTHLGIFLNTVIYQVFVSLLQHALSYPSFYFSLYSQSCRCSWVTFRKWQIPFWNKEPLCLSSHSKWRTAHDSLCRHRISVCFGTWWQKYGGRNMGNKKACRNQMVLVKQNDNKNNSPIFQMSCSSAVVFSLAFTASSALIAIPLGCGQITSSIWRLLNYNNITRHCPQ